MQPIESHVAGDGQPDPPSHPGRDLPPPPIDDPPDDPGHEPPPMREPPRPEGDPPMTA